MSGMVLPPEIPLLYRIILAILSFLFYHIKLSIVLSKSIKNCVGILMVITLNHLVRWLWYAYDKTAIITISVLLIHKHGRAFHLLIPSPTSFFKDLKFLSYRSFAFLVRVIPRYFILFGTIVKDVDFLISFWAHLSFVFKRATDIFLVNFICCHLIKGAHQL